MSAILFNKKGEQVRVAPRQVSKMLATGEYFSVKEQNQDIFADGVVTLDEAKEKAKSLGIKVGRKGLAKLLEEIKAAEDAKD